MTDDRLGDHSPELRKTIVRPEPDAVQPAPAQSHSSIEWTVAPVPSGYIARIQVTILLTGDNQ